MWSAPSSGVGNVTFTCYFTKSITENYYAYLAPAGVSRGADVAAPDDSWDISLTVIVVVMTIIFLEGTMIFHGSMSFLSLLFYVAYSLFRGHSIGWQHVIQQRRPFSPPQDKSLWFASPVRYVTEDFWPGIVELTYGQVALVLIFVLGMVIAGVIKSIAQDTLDPGHGPARATGWITSILCILLLLPTAHTNIWVKCFGLSFERAIKFHRILARAFIISTYFHMICSGDHWGWDVVVRWTATGREPVYPLYGFIAMLLSSLMAALALEPVRRLHFEVFFFSHKVLFPLVVIFVVIHLWHVRSFVTLMVGACVLYLLDRLVGYTRSWTKVELDKKRGECEYVGGASVLQINETGYFQRGGFGNKCGDYCFVCVPQVSKWQWHPFTISSAPLKPITLHIKDMGAGTWSGGLAELVKKGELDSDGVMMDGPYGSFQVDLDRYTRLVLVAGGIGVTPMASILSEILGLKAEIESRHKRSQVEDERIRIFDSMEFRDSFMEDAGTAGKSQQKFSELRDVHFIWVTKEPEQFDWFKPALLDAFSTEFVEVNLYCTNLGQRSATWQGQSVVPDRPDIQSIMNTIKKEQDEKKRGVLGQGDVACLVCGPTGLVNSVARAATKHKFHLHKETYFL